MSKAVSLVALSCAFVAFGGATDAMAAAPHVERGVLTAARIQTGSAGSVYSLGAIVRLDRALTRTEKNTRRFGLIAATWAGRTRLRDRAVLPDALFGGTNVGTIGKRDAHCYAAEVAQLHPHATVTFGLPWRLAIHDGRRVLGAGLRVVLRRSRGSDELAAARSLGYFG